MTKQFLKAVHAFAARHPYDSPLSLWRNQRGNAAMMFAIALPGLITGAGAAVDYSRISGARSALQSALDTGVVAATTASNGTSLTQATTTVQAFVANNKGRHNYRDTVVTVTTPDAQTVKATATACIDLYFGSFLNKSASCFDAVAEAKRGKNHLEVVMVLDNTGSMDTPSNRIGNLRAAATKLVDELKTAASGTRSVQMALVPFVTAVNVNGIGFKSSWIDNNAQNPLHGANFDPPAGSPAGTKVNHFTLLNAMRVNWKGCVEARPAPYNLDDSAPSLGNPSTLFVPYFAPDEPGASAAGGNDGNNFNNSYLDDVVAGTDLAKERSIAKYGTASTAKITEAANSLGVTGGAGKTGSNITNGPNRACPTPIVPLTDNYDLLKTNIAAMRHWNGSGTNVSEGLMWGWRVLSPEEPYTGGLSFNDPSVQKVIVLLTDGENVVFGAKNTINKSDYGSYGFLASGRFGSQDQNTAARNVDGWMLQTCSALKNKDVLIYTITLEADTAANRTLYSQCATRPDMYYPSPNASQLSGIFSNIAQQLISLKLTQ